MNYLAGNDYESGSPHQVRAQQSFAQMAQKAPEMLRQINPQAYGTLTDTIIQGRIADAYEKAALEQKPSDYDANGLPVEGSPFRKAQEMDYGLTGKYQTELKKVDPEAKRIQDFERRQTEFNTKQTNMMESQLKTYNNTQVEGPKLQKTQALVDKILEPVKSRYNDVIFGDLKGNINRELIDAMRGQSTATYPNGIPGQAAWYAEHKQAWGQLVNDFRTSWDAQSPGRGLEARVQAFQQDWLNRANRYLPSIAAPRIATATRTPGAARTTPAAKAPQRAATQPASAGPPQPKPRLTSDQWDAELADALKIA